MDLVVFFLWEETLRNALGIGKTETSHVNENKVEGLGKGGDLEDIDHIERMTKQHRGRDEITEIEAPMGGEEHDETAKLSTPSKSVGFPEFEIIDDLQDLDMDSVPWDIIEKKAVSYLTTPSMKRCLERELDKESSDVAEASFGIFTTSNCSIVPNKENMPPGFSCSKFDNLEQLEQWKNEATTSQGDFCRLKLEIEGSQGLVFGIVSSLQTRFPNISPSIVAADGATPQHGSAGGLS